MRCKSLFVLRVDHYFNWRTKFTAPSRQQETMLWLTLASRPCVSRASLCFKCFKGLPINYNRHNWGLAVWLWLKRLKQPFDQAKVKCEIWSSKSIVLIKTKHISGLVSLPGDSNWISWIWDWMLEVGFGYPQNSSLQSSHQLQSTRVWPCTSDQITCICEMAAHSPHIGR